MKGTTIVVSGTETKLTVVTPTANTLKGSNVLTNVSSFSNIVQGGSITGPGIPTGARVSVFDSVAQTITVTDNQGNTLNATADGTGIQLQINKGCVSYSWGAGDTATIDTYQVEHEINWPGGIQTFPSATYGSIQILADLEGA